MNDRLLLQEINRDLQHAALGQKVIYLEGKTDTPVFFALLGVPAPADGLHAGVLVKGLTNAGGGQGATAVCAYVDLAERTNGYRGKIFGIIDGDGKSLAELRGKFEAPFMGPRFTWTGYSIESLLIQTGWPPLWGPSPSWQAILEEYSSYVALSQLYRHLRGVLDTLRLTRYLNPDHSRPLETVDDMAAAIERDKHLLSDGDGVLRMFRENVTQFRTTVAADLQEAHALLNGKWLLKRIAADRHVSEERCRDEWIAHVTRNGGLFAVRALWARIVGSAP